MFASLTWLLLAGIFAVALRTPPRPSPPEGSGDDRDLPPGPTREHRTAAIGCGLLAVVIAHAVDSGWLIDRNGIGIIEIPAACVVVGLGCAAFAILDSRTPRHARSHSQLALQGILAMFAFGLISCGGVFMYAMR
jgi:hypothetical protein